jgi:hypothetical protein
MICFDGGCGFVSMVVWVDVLCEPEERQMCLTPLKRALISGELPMTYKVHNPRSPRGSGTGQHSPPMPETRRN